LNSHLHFASPHVHVVVFSFLRH